MTIGDGTREYACYSVGYGYFPMGTTLTSKTLPSYWSPSGYDHCYGSNDQYGYGDVSEYTTFRGNAEFTTFNVTIRLPPAGYSGPLNLTVNTSAR
jgi:hypothetical protein